MPLPTFEEYIGGIEDGIVEALRAPAEALGVTKVSTYSGDLDAENLKRSIAGNATEFPKIMIAYGNGNDIIDPKNQAVYPGKPIHFRHSCWFTAIVASNDARSEKIRRRGDGLVPGTYGLMNLVRQRLTGLTIKSGSQMLTFEPLRPLATDNILRIPNVTAYALIFGTYFRWKWEPTITPGVEVTDLFIDVEGLNQHPSNYTQELPGVKFE